MARRYCGDVVVDIRYLGWRGGRDVYAARVCARYVPPRDGCWSTRGLSAPAFPFAYDSPEAYDRMAESAIGFATYWDSEYEREGGPSQEVAEQIQEAAFCNTDSGGYPVSRRYGEEPGDLRRHKRRQRSLLGGATRVRHPSLRLFRDLPVGKCFRVWYGQTGKVFRKSTYRDACMALPDKRGYLWPVRYDVIVERVGCPPQAQQQPLLGRKSR